MVGEGSSGKGGGKERRRMENLSLRGLGKPP